MSVYRPYQLKATEGLTEGLNGEARYQVPFIAGSPTIEAPPVSLPSSSPGMFQTFGAAGTADAGSSDKNGQKASNVPDRVNELESEYRELQHQLEIRDSAEKWYISQALADNLAVFLLSKAVELDGIDIALLADRLEAPTGWLAIGMLWRAHLIERFDTRMVPTDLGRLCLQQLYSLASTAAKQSLPPR
jgi:hypothetical protein